MTSRLWITEKPQAARSLAAGVCAAYNVTIANPQSTSKDGFIKLSNGEVITYLFGHLIQANFLSPEHKSARLEEYFDILPIVVKDFKYEPRYEINKDGSVKMSGGKPVPIRQYTIVTGLIRGAKEIVNAGDIDREGQLIVDELLIHVGIDPARPKKTIYRLPLVSDKTDDVRKLVLGLSEMNSDKKWVLKRDSAMARQYCDAALGFNGSMAYQASSGYRRASVGRVQTPVLCMVVDRDEQVRNFKPRNYFVPVVTLADGTEMRFHKREGAAGTPGFDEEGRIIDEAMAKRMCEVISSGRPGRISLARMTSTSESAPLPFSSTVLYSTVSKRTGMLPAEVDAAAQSLKDKHKAISYIGTDCRFLPTSMLEDARSTMTALAKLYPQQAGGSTLSLRSKAWNDEKVTEHYGIIPTGVIPVGMTPGEKAVFEAVSNRYIAQFYPNHEYKTHQVEAFFGDDEFRSTRREVTKEGWKQIEGHLEQGGSMSEVEEMEGESSKEDQGIEVRSARDSSSRQGVK
jgi:DNA topoisomerase III